MKRNILKMFQNQHLAKEGVIVSLLFLAVSCHPRVEMVAPDKPININLNVKIEHEVRVRIEKDLDQVISKDSPLF